MLARLSILSISGRLCLTGFLVWLLPRENRFDFTRGRGGVACRQLLWGQLSLITKQSECPTFGCSRYRALTLTIRHFALLGVGQSNYRIYVRRTVDSMQHRNNASF